MSDFDFLNPLQNVSLRLTEQQIAEITEWFDTNSKPLLIINEEEPINAITVDKIKEFLELKKYHRRNFHYPSYAEIMIEVEKLKAGITRMLTKEQFIYMLDKWVIEADIKHEIKLAFKVFDTEKRSFLDIDNVKVIVTTYADVFDEQETRELLRDANVKGDCNVFYEDFVESLFSVAPELYQLKTEYLYEDPNDDPSVPPVVTAEEEISQPLAPPEPVPDRKDNQKKKK
ncbi:unnamed protein product, partial [Brenthis ino]